jgi:CrcB protein
MIERDQAGCTIYGKLAAYRTFNPHNANFAQARGDFHVEKLIAIALGGAVGALSRYAIVVAAVKLMGDRFPYGVLLANIAGCFVIGMVMHEAIVEGRWLPATSHLALTVGFLGGLTTFSSFGYDTFLLM